MNEISINEIAVGITKASIMDLINEALTHGVYALSLDDFELRFDCEGTTDLYFVATRIPQTP